MFLNWHGFHSYLHFRRWTFSLSLGQKVAMNDKKQRGREWDRYIERKIEWKRERKKEKGRKREIKKQREKEKEREREIYTYVFIVTFCDASISHLQMTSSNAAFGISTMRFTLFHFLISQLPILLVRASRHFFVCFLLLNVNCTPKWSFFLGTKNLFGRLTDLAHGWLKS